MLHGGIVRSPISSGEITSIQLPSDIPDNITFCSPNDIPGSKTISFFSDSLPVLAEKRVHYEGQPVLLLSSPSPQSLREFSRKTMISYKQEPSLPSVGKYESNQVHAKRKISYGNLKKAFKSAFQIVESSYQTFYQSPIPPDPEGAFAYSAEGKLFVYSTTTWLSHVQSSIASVLKLAIDDIIVYPLELAPPYDSKVWTSTLYAIYAALLSWKAKKPVRIIDYFFSQFYGGHLPNSCTCSLSTAIDKEGKIEGTSMKVDFDCGAFPLFSNEIIRRAMVTALSELQSRNIDISINLIKTNSPPALPSPSLGQAHVFFALETHASRLAEICFTSPVEWKRSNIILPKDEQDINIPAGKMYGKLLNRLLGESDFERKYAGYEMMKKRRTGLAEAFLPQRGIGISTGMQGSGFITDTETKLNSMVSVRLDNKPSVTIRTTAVTGHQALEKLWAHMVGQILEIPPENVSVERSGTGSVIDTGPSILSRNLSIATRLIAKCCEAIRKKRFRTPLPIEIKRSLKSAISARWDDEKFSGTPFVSQALGAAIVEVEIDQVTLETEIRGVWLYAACGGVLDPVSARNCLEAGIYHALTWASREQLWVKNQHRSGQIYKIPDIFQLPEVHIQFIEAEKKNISEGIEALPFILVPAAYINAISQATGIYFDSIPVYPERIERTLEEL
jgi:CO/xanthine dehydrogenase Mo-binding subunit